MTAQLANKIALVTGGASGIGRATAVLFAQSGAKVVVADIDAAGGAETVQTIIAQGDEAFFIQADVSQSDAVQQMINETVARYGRLDCAFNNAGIEGDIRRTADVTEEDFDRIMAVNLKGVWLCLKYEIRQML
ncbi:MAG TPA: SDR family NAD(P)-dependent oxidoreductase, partial [Anaerolineae bacterium]|nr:SDR family NAD(P)-dependent oxidoreductase [Anaerolineae bacterium]